MVDNRIYSTDQDIPGIIVNIVSKDTGDEIPLSTPSTSSPYTIGGRSGIGLFDFSIDKPGIYEISASYPATNGQQEEQTQEIVLDCYPQQRYGSHIWQYYGYSCGCYGHCVGTIPAGIAFIIITFLKRRKVRTRTTAQ